MTTSLRTRVLACALLGLACTPQAPAASDPSGPVAGPVAGSVEPAPAQADEPPALPLPERMPAMDFGLSDDDYWNEPTKTSEAVVSQLWARNQDGVAIGAPSFVALGSRESLPLVTYRGASYRELWALSMREYAQVVAVELEHNRVYVGPVVADDEAVSKKRLNPADAPAGQGSESRVGELRSELGLPWQPSTYVLTVLMREHVSNRVRVALGQKPGGYHDEEVERFLAAERSKPAAPAVAPKPGTPVPSYQAIEGSPAIPDAPGIALASDRVVVQEPGARSILRGAFRLPVTPTEHSGNDSAVVGVTLVVNASEQPQSGVLRLDIPAQRSGDEATGYFAIDLIAEGLANEPQTYFVYAFSREHMAGPTPAALVAKSRL